MLQPTSKAIIMAFLLFFAMLGLRGHSVNFSDGDKVSAVVATVHGEKIVKISVNDIPETEGKLMILDKDNKTVYSVNSADLIKAPYYYGVSVADLPAGSYTVVITTKVSKYVGVFTINQE